MRASDRPRSPAASALPGRAAGFQARGFTLIEAVIALALFVAVAAYLADSFIFVAKAERSVSKKAMTARALQYVQGRIRRDAEWARTVKVVGGSPVGTGVEFGDFKGGKRIYKWDSTSKRLKMPDLTDPCNQAKAKDYDQCKFRYVEFYTNEAGGEGIRVVMAPLPMDEKDEISKGNEVLWGVSMVARTELDFQSVGHRYALFNEHFYPAGQPKTTP